MGNFLKSVAFFAPALIFVLLAVFLSNWVSQSQEQKPPEIAEVEIPNPIECPADLVEFSSTTKKLDVLVNKPSNGTGGLLKGYKVTLERSGLSSEIACGYLLYQVSFDKKPIEQKSMALVMRPTHSQLGGHILPDNNTRAIIDDLPDRTQVLMPLSSITFDGRERTPIKEINWAILLNSSTAMEFEIGLSADTSKGKIDRVQLAYKCVNIETRRETDVCELKLAGDPQPFGF